ncbi:putative universal stress protein SERP1273 [Symsagittifera roscoffensis]|uniref:putative universal stress protein SERP1273 n=1 Tax=Symsagittifera roscoffensis TaxID=84072 RepID=UPI00307B189A
MSSSCSSPPRTSSSSKHHSSKSVFDGERRVLIAVDGSANAEYAFDFYCTFVSRSRDTVILFHFMDPVSTSSDPDLAFDELRRYKGHYMEGLERMFASRARKHGLDPETMSFGFSCDPPEPGKAVVAYVRQNPVDLIVIGCRGLSKLKKAFIGSVSDYVIRHSGIPVLTVPLNQQQQQPTHQQRNNSMT